MTVPPLRIGSLTIPIPVALAPMSGYTTVAFRLLCRRFHCGLVFTELVTAEGVRRRVARTLHFLESYPAERPVAAHIFGSNPDALAEAARVVESLGRFDLVDLNCGCPVPKVMNRQAGAALMRDPEKIRRIVQAMAQATSLPVTVKTRLGLSKESCNVSEVAQAVEEGGGRALFLHARFASEKHHGPVDLEALQRVKQERSIPVIGNGGVARAQDACDMLARTGVDGVMIGRAAIGNPWIFEEVYSLFCGHPFQPPSKADRRRVIEEHLRGIYESALIEKQIRRHWRRSTERAACRRFLKHLVKYLAGMRGWEPVQKRLMEMDSLEDAMAAVDEVLNAPQGNG